MGMQKVQVSACFNLKNKGLECCARFFVCFVFVFVERYQECFCLIFSFHYNYFWICFLRLFWRLIDLCVSAFMPSPILFGEIVDTTCLIWQSGCSKQGACVYYNIVDFRLKIHTFSLILFMIAASSTLFAFVKTRKWTSWKPNY